MTMLYVAGTVLGWNCYALAALSRSLPLAEIDSCPQLTSPNKAVLKISVKKWASLLSCGPVLPLAQQLPLPLLFFSLIYEVHLHSSGSLRSPCPRNIPHYMCKNPDKSVPHYRLEEGTFHSHHFFLMCLYTVIALFCPLCLKSELSLW